MNGRFVLAVSGALALAGHEVDEVGEEVEEEVEGWRRRG
jgi:hypothetical protein